jgi:transposase
MVSQEYVYAYAAVSIPDGGLDTLILPHVNSDCMQIFLDKVAARHSDERLVMVLDGAGWHKASALNVPKNIRLVYLPPYSPELNPVEHIWDEIREKAFGNLAFNSLDALESHLEMTLLTMEQDEQKVASLVSCPWIVNSLLN